MPLILPKGSLITLDSVELTEHGRKPARIDYDPIELGQRTLSGTMRKQHITHKRKIALSWENVPSLDAQTADGKAGRDTIKGIVDTHRMTSTAAILVSYKESDTPVELYCFIESYDEELVKRFDRFRWNMSLSLIEQ